MDENKLYTCCFFGHRSIKLTDELKIKLRCCIEDLIIHRNVTDFLFESIIFVVYKFLSCSVSACNLSVMVLKYNQTYVRTYVEKVVFLCYN